MEETIHLLIMYTMLVLSLLLFHKGRKNQRSLMLAFYALVEVLTNGIISLNLYAGYSFFQHYPFSHFIYKPLYCLWAPLFYLYFRYCFSIKFRFQKKHWLHFLPFIISAIVFLSVWILLGNNFILENLYGKNSNISKLSHAVDIFVKMQYVVYNTLMIVSLLRLEKIRKTKKKNMPDISVKIGWIRFIVLGYAIACLGSIVSHYFNLTKHPNSGTIGVVILSYFLIFFFVIFYNTITHKSFEPDSKSKVLNKPNDEMYQLMRKVEELVKGKKMYLDPDCSLQQIAAELNEKERTISMAINNVENRNFKDYLSNHRIDYACMLLLNNKEKPIFEVMYESGFNTKGAFNLAFKKITGKTPTEFRETGINS